MKSIEFFGYLHLKSRLRLCCPLMIIFLANSVVNSITKNSFQRSRDVSKVKADVQSSDVHSMVEARVRMFHSPSQIDINFGRCNCRLIENIHSLRLRGGGSPYKVLVKTLTGESFRYLHFIEDCDIIWAVISVFYAKCSIRGW